MKASDIVRRAGRSLRTAKARTALTSLAIAVGAFTLTLTLAAGNGVRDYTDRLVASNFDPAELIVGRDPEIENQGLPDSKPREYNESLVSVNFGNGNAGALQLEQITDQDIEELKTLPYVKSVRPVFTINARYVEANNGKKYALDMQTYSSGQKPELVAGSLDSVEDLSRGDIIIPQVYLDLLGLGSANEAIGKEVSINIAGSVSKEAILSAVMASQTNGATLDASSITPKSKDFKFKIIGVSKRSATSISSVGGLPLIIGSQDAQEVYDYSQKGDSNYGKYLYVYVRAVDGEKDGVAADVKSKLKALDYTVQTTEDVQKTITQFVDVLQILVGVFGVITVIASVFGIVNTMYISVLERTRQIGLMKALGMRGKHVSWLFRVEAAWIGVLGGALGAAGAFVLGISINPYLTELLSLGAGNSILIFDPIQIGLLILVLMLVAILAGWFPARKAAKLDPIEALRVE